jgi:Tfp pilus assembly protein PilE
MVGAGEGVVANNRFTLIEVVLMATIIGLLAMIAGPQVSHARERTYLSLMKSDLRNFATAEESYFYDFAVYTAGAASLQQRGFRASQNVTLTVNEATTSGWSATVTNTLTLQQCYFYLGSAAPVGSATSEGLIACS